MTRPLATALGVLLLADDAALDRAIRDLTEMREQRIAKRRADTCGCVTADGVTWGAGAWACSCCAGHVTCPRCAARPELPW